MPRRVLAVVGPTASGKTRTGVELARRYNGEVVSVDSMQIYRRMDIGTAKVTPEEMEGIPHHMIDVAEPEESFSVARYVELAVPVVEDILDRGKTPVLVGGTGLYLDSLVSGRSFAVQATGWRETLQRRAQEEGLEPLRRELEKIDPEAAARIGGRDEKRIIRALEVWYETGKTITCHNRETLRLPPRYEAVTVGLNFVHRPALWARIDRRVDEMMERGLVDEVQGLLDGGLSPACTAMQAIGYKEIAAALLTGGDLEAAAGEVKLRSRQYAKRQLTWFRRNQDTLWVNWADTPDFEAGVQIMTTFVSTSGL